MLRSLAGWLGLPRVPRAWNGTQRGHGVRGLGRWSEDVPRHELEELEAHPRCRWFMRRAGYRSSQAAGGWAEAANYVAWAPRPDALRLVPAGIFDEGA
eukprot:5545712-Prymnesium_polylepis.2